MKRIIFEKVAASSGMKPSRLYAILGGTARMLPVEYGAISKAVGREMEFFLPNNPEYQRVMQGVMEQEQPEEISK